MKIIWSLVVWLATAFHASAVSPCLEEGNPRYNCQLSSTGIMFLTNCIITDEDHEALAKCFDSVGRENFISVRLGSNHLTYLPAGIFDNFGSLLRLNFSNNRLKTLPPGIFDSLNLLTSLALEDNELATLPAGIFDNLGSLTYLGILNNRDLTCFPGLPPGADTDIVDAYGYAGYDDTYYDYDFSGSCGCDFGSLADPCKLQGATCTPGTSGYVCEAGDDVVGDPHMRGLHGQRIDWSGVDGGWYSLIKDGNAGFDINARVTAPLPDEFPDRQLVTGLAVLSKGRSLVIEVENPYTIDTHGCPEGVSPCLANGGLRTVVDGQEVDELLRFYRHVPVADGAMTLSASNLPVECRQFGGDKIWARIYQDMMKGKRQLRGDESLEEWILKNDHGMAAPSWCAKYIAENNLADVQSNHAIFKIQTPTVTVRLNAGVNYQGNGELNWDGRVLPDLEFWQMDVGIDGLDVANPNLSGLLGETARPVYDENGQAVMEGFDAFRGTIEDYRVSGALDVDFPLLHAEEEGH